MAAVWATQNQNMASQSQAPAASQALRAQITTSAAPEGPQDPR